MDTTVYQSSWSTQRRVLWVVLLVILLVGWGLRTHDLEKRSLWGDEGWTMLLSRGPGLVDVIETLADDQHPPLFFVLFRAWRSVAGETEFAGRYFSVLLSMLAIAAIYQLARGLFSPAVGVWAALLLMLSDLHIDMAQEVRHYTALGTLIILSSWCYVRWLRHPGWISRVSYVVTSSLLLYTHYLGGFVLMAQAAHMLLTVRPWRRLSEALVLFGVVCALFLPWLPVVLEQNSVRWDNPLYYQNALPNNMDTFRAVRAALFGSQAGLMAGLMLLGCVSLAYSCAGGKYRVRADFRPTAPTLFLMIWAGLMAGLTIVINEYRQFLTVRNFIVITPALVVLMAHGLENLERTAQLFLVGIIVIVGLTTVDARRHYPDWRTVTRHVTAYHLDEEPVLMDIWVGDFPVRYYIDRQMGPDTPRVSLREWRDTYKTQFLPTLLGYLRELDAFWLVYWGDTPLDEYGGLITEAGFVRSATLSVDHYGTPLYSYRYDKKPDTHIAMLGELFALRKVDAPSQASAGDTVSLALWWTAEQPISIDYSVSAFLLNQSGILVAHQDGPPLDGNAPTSIWQPGDLKFDMHRLVLPADLPPGRYQWGIKVYWYGDGKPLPVTQNGQPMGDYVPVGELEVKP